MIWVAIGAVVFVGFVFGLLRASSRGSRAEEQRDREGGWRP